MSSIVANVSDSASSICISLSEDYTDANVLPQPKLKGLLKRFSSHRIQAMFSCYELTRVQQPSETSQLRRREKARTKASLGPLSAAVVEPEPENPDYF